MARSSIGVVTAVLVMAVSSHARAQSCGGNDDGGGSDGDSDWGSSYSDDGGSDSESADVCRDTTEITGLEQCTRFGAGWDVSSTPALSLGLSLGIRRLSLDPIRLGGTSMHDANPYTWTVAGSDLADPEVRAVVFALRGSIFVTDFTYVGVDAGIGGGSAAGPAIAAGELTLRPESALVISGAGLIGVSVPIGGLALRVEVLAGVRVLSVGFESRRGDCVTRTTAWSTAPLVEPRVVLDLFTSPWLTVGVYGGADVIDALGWHAGMSVALHARSYDGQ